MIFADKLISNLPIIVKMQPVIQIFSENTFFFSNKIIFWIMLKWNAPNKTFYHFDDEAVDE